MRGSCHYGGQNGKTGSYAVDFRTNVLSTESLNYLKEAIGRCFPTGNIIDHSSEASNQHIHASVGACSGE
jgi:hypothetical protein